MSEVTIDSRRNSIGDAGLFDETRQEQHHCAAHINIGKSFGGNELRQKIHCANNRARYQRREETNEQRKIDKIRNGSLLSTVDVDGVTHRVKRVEADADRQNNI